MEQNKIDLEEILAKEIGVARLDTEEGSILVSEALSAMKEAIEKAIPLVLQIAAEKIGHWQLCPKCNGQGTVSKPPYIAGDVNEWSSTLANHRCNLCGGTMKIWNPSSTSITNLETEIKKQIL